MNKNGTLHTRTRQIFEVRNISSDLLEKSLNMRALAYLSSIKADLLRDTIFQIDSSKKLLCMERNGLEEKIRERTTELEISVKKLQAVEGELRKTNDELERRVKDRTAEVSKLSYAVEQSPVSVVITDTEGNIEYANPKFTQLTGYSLEEAVGVNQRILKSGKTSPEVYKELWKTITSGNEWRGEFYNKKKNGELYWESASISPIKNDVGDITNFIAVREDSTERKLAEEKLQYARDYSDSLINSSLDMIISVDIDRHIVTFNSAAEKTFGYKKEEVLGKHVGMLYGGESQGLPVYKTTIGSGTFEGEVENKRKDGSVFVSQLSTTALRDLDENIIGLMGISRDITERKNNESKLMTAMEAAESANEAKSTFLSSMSHEIRTPMNSILGFSQLLVSNQNEPLTESQKSNVNHILDSGHLLLKLINEVLDLSSIESGKTQISMESIEVASVIEMIIASVEPMALKYNVNIINSVEHSGQYIKADYTRLKQVLINLLSNAIKYNRVDGTVTVWNELTEANMIRINVEDTGPGIAMDNIESLFEPFNRLGEEALDKEGTGIGLTITKRLVELMGGSIHVESDVGKDTKFYIEFDKAKAPASETDKTEDVLDDFQRIDKTEEKILLYVEDNPANLKLVESILKRRPNIKLISSAQAQPGIELAREHHPDMILMDINLPGMDGYEALKLLKSYDDIKKIPVIAISANAMPKDIEKSKSAGFKYYITKPININKFLGLVDDILPP